MQLTQPETQPFPYTKLSANPPTIRLLHLKRTSIGEITGSLEQFPLETAKYNAISYVWGPKTHSRLVKINNHPVLFFENLYQILEVICSDEKLSKCWWWIDYICINQGDGFEVETERNSQVAMMKQIYQNASMVLGWLGPGDEETERGMMFLHVLKKNRNRLNKEKNGKERVLGVELEDREKWKAVENILLRPWWDRVWTLQEYIVPRNFKFYCGKDNIDRGDLKVAIYAIYLSLAIDASLMAKKAYDRAWIRRRLLMWYRECLPMHLLGLIAYVGDCRFTNPRDRIYSVLGLIDDGDLVGQPRYGDDVSKVYTDLVMRFAEKYKSLDIVCLADRFNWSMVKANPMSRLPSWCPDWRAEDIPWVVPAMACQSSGNIDNFRPTKSASKQREKEATYAAGISRRSFQVGVSEDRKILSCQGIFIDYVDGIGGLRVARKRKDDGTDIWEEYECVQSSTSKNIPLSQQGTNDNHMTVPELKSRTANRIMWEVTRCLMLDRKDRYLDQTLSPGFCHFRDLCLTAVHTPENVSRQFFLDWFKRNRQLHIQGHSLEDICKESLEVPSDENESFPDQETFLSRFQDSTRRMSRRFMTTRNGNTGMVPCRTEKGDEIWVLHGCRIPMVLRKADKEATFNVVGECYLNDFMNGEAFNLLDGETTAKLESIRLV
ncbi:HET-domain-containing protein [Mollisia scopiformis]|uniref:HET-domain-containing protein n=1 Tax=Mollisia scopiformis TaxID=149040 RepID=A0A194XA97_MOLSC|nr:HET-domain-containing protein [Mollisia scopiformis]KUJ16687.1 HET-domain-containing protein [Mollisia scopiformis]